MLNVEQYISGGIVESYVLGIADEQEKRELEALLPLYPELRTAIELFEADLERSVLQHAIAPPQKVWNAIRRRIQEPPHSNTSRNGNGKGETFIPIVSESNDHIRVHKYWRYAFIGIFILSKIFLFFMLYYYFMYKEAAKERNSAQETLQHIRPGR